PGRWRCWRERGAGEGRRNCAAWQPIHDNTKARRSLFGRRPAADRLEPGQVVALARRHEEVLLAVALLTLFSDVAAVVNRHLAGAGDLELLSAHDDRRAFVEADAEHVGVRRHHLFEIVLAIAREHV